MAYWYGNRRNERYIYRKVAWATWAEHDQYDNITGGSIELSAFSDLRASGSISFEGGSGTIDENELLRIYYAFTDDSGQTEQECLGTFFVSTAQARMQAEYIGMTDTGLRASGDASLSSTLKVLLDKVCGTPLTIASGTNVVSWAASQIESLGLNVNATPDTYTLSAAYTFEAGTTWLTIVNTALGWANYASATPDAYGTIVLAPYVEPTKRDAVMTFRNDEESILYPEVTDARDWESTPNVVRLLYETDEECLYATATNNDSQSSTSLAARGGRETTLFAKVDEISGSTQAARIEALKAQAAQKLQDNSTLIQYLTISHAYVPISMGDAIRVVYSDREWSGTAVGLTISLSPSTKATLRIRTFVRNGFEITTGGGVVWSL